MNIILYAYCNPDNILHQTQYGELPGTPFYIGIGKHGRQLDHLKFAKGKRPDLHNPKKTQHIRQLMYCNTPPIIVVMKDRLMLDEAKTMEKKVIAEIGTESVVKYVEKRGALFNLHRGGGGGVGNKKPRSQETRRNMSEAAKKVVRPPEQIAALIAAGANRTRSPEENKRRGQSIARALQNRTPEQVAALVEKRKAKGWISEEGRAELSKRAEEGYFRKNIQPFIASGPDGEEVRGDDMTAFCLSRGFDPQNAWLNLKRKNPIKKGPMQGWRFLVIVWEE